MTTSARDALWLLFILIVIGAIYSFSGRGLNLSSLGGGPRLSPSQNSETTYKNESIFGSSEQNTETERSSKTTTSQITISTETAGETNPQKEYVIIKNNGETSINLGGVKIKNKNGIEAKIDPDENGNPIILKPREQAVILTGKSTRGTNFKINKCSGYFKQFYSFAPALSATCPRINSLSEADKLDDACLDYLPKIKTCQMPTSLPTNLTSNCQGFIQQHGSYQGCVLDHKNDNDFDKGEWRIFLNRIDEFWAKRNETIKLVGSDGKIIVEANY
ncbi:MAG TPA: lamin tail domain-containing protein [Candidatus Paceibacterota bacterium]